MAINRWATLFAFIGPLSCGNSGSNKVSKLQPPDYSSEKESPAIPPTQENQQNDCSVVFDQCVQKSTAFYQQEGQIFHREKKLQIKGINWFGLEVRDTRLHGLWTGRSLESFVDQMHSLGFNAFRIPIAPEVLDWSTLGSDGYPTARSQLERLLAYTRDRGMYVLLDLHNCSKNNTHSDKPGPGLGVCVNYPVARWIEDLKEMARLSLWFPNVIGIDIFNEPYGFTWSQWRPLAEKAGEAILRINPRILVFVEGVGAEQYKGRFLPFWGENLSEVTSDPVKLPLSQIVYSPHVYGPSVAAQEYFEEEDFPSNMPEIWDEHFGHLKGRYAIVVGEFGGTHQGQDQIWQDYLISYLRNKGQKDFFYWAMNPNSGDTGGLLEDDWRGVVHHKYEALKPLLYW